jgi:hypothetical protein
MSSPPPASTIDRMQSAAFTVPLLPGQTAPVRQQHEHRNAP